MLQAKLITYSATQVIHGIKHLLLCLGEGLYKLKALSA